VLVYRGAEPLTPCRSKPTLVLKTHSTKSAIILTALDLEARAVLRHMPGWKEETVDGTVFYLGSFDNWSVAVAEVGVGNASAAAVTERAIRHFDPHVALFVGVAGGVKDVALGDVVVATKVYGYESGKEDPKGFKPRAEVFRTSHEIEQRGRALGKRDNWRNRFDPSIEHGTPRIVVGPIAAGEKIVATSAKGTARRLSQLYGDAVAVEMEGRGFLEGLQLNSEVRGGVIRGISDLLDGKAQADKAGWQQRAADAASAAAFEILSGLVGGAATAMPVSSPKERQKSSRVPTQEPPSRFAKSEPNIDANAAYIQILRNGNWDNNERLKPTTGARHLARDWREKKLDDEIHKALVNSKLDAWGEEILPNGAIAPDRPIPADAWTKIEIIFGRVGQARTQANLRVAPPHTGKMAWVGIRFAREQFFQLFPLLQKLAQRWAPISEAIAYVAQVIGETQDGSYFSRARQKLRQAALNGEITIKGNKSSELMNGSSWSAVQTDVPRDYWETAEISVIAVDQATDDMSHTFPHQFSDGRYGDLIFLYANLRVDMTEISKKWPA
jgi:nucleoside phosphorylase